MTSETSLAATPRYLLIVACSQRKRLDPEPLPAIERYDGGTFRVLRKARREGYWPACLDVFILSARYGLVDADESIVLYEQRMTGSRAATLRSQVVRTLSNLAHRNAYGEIYVDLGRDYLPAAKDLCHLFKDIPVTYAEGRIGERLARLRCWLIKRSIVNDADSNQLESSCQ